MPLVSIDPATGERLEEFAEYTPAEVDAILGASDAAFRAWRDRPIAERAARVRDAGAVLRANRGRYADAMTREMGKPIRQSESEIEKCAWVCEHYADHGPSMLAPEEIASDGARSYVRFDPLGVVLAVMPWNFPFWQVFRFAAPALVAGNTGVLKHASNVQRCGLLIEEVFREAGLPPDCFRTLVVGSAAVERVVRHPLVRAATLTGSEPAGSAVAACAGRALKKTVLELGGSDPFVVLHDADVADAAAVAATARLINTGQSCIAAKRFIVEKAVADEFEQLFVAAVRAKVVGDPRDPAVDVGPMAREDLLAELDAQVRRSVELGARVLAGGGRLDRPGAFYAPTVLGDVRPGMPAFDEELFGPVAAVVRVRDAEEAVTMANATAFGLGASVWTSEAARAEDIARRIESGSVFVNGMVKSDPRLPFGGVKRSGYGRELSRFGILEFVNVKTVWIR